MRAGTLAWSLVHLLERVGCTHLSRVDPFLEQAHLHCVLRADSKMLSDSGIPLPSSQLNEMVSQAGRILLRQRADPCFCPSFLSRASPRAQDGFTSYTGFKKRGQSMHYG